MKEIEDFKQYLIDGEKSLTTINTYIYSINEFIQYIDNKSIKEIINNDIISYKDYMLYKRFLDPKTINKKLVAIKQFLSFNKVIVTVRQIKLHNQNFISDIFEKDDIEKIIKATENKNDLRAKALIMTLQLTGARISEVLQITIKDIHKDAIMIVGKGAKRRYIFIPKKLKKVWIDYCRIRIDKTDKLFTGKKGAITSRTADRIIKKYGELAGVEFEKNHAHNFRHTYASSLINDKGLNIEVVKDLCGHVSLNTTAIYTQKTKKQLLEIIEDL